MFVPEDEPEKFDAPIVPTKVPLPEESISNFVTVPTLNVKSKLLPLNILQKLLSPFVKYKEGDAPELSSKVKSPPKVPLPDISALPFMSKLPPSISPAAVKVPMLPKL